MQSYTLKIIKSHFYFGFDLACVFLSFALYKNFCKDFLTRSSSLNPTLAKTPANTKIPLKHLK